MEEWRAVPGYEGLYEVSNMGNVRNVRRNTLLKLSKNNNEYIRVCLCKNCIRTLLSVHRLVAQAFIPNPNNLPQVNHKDEDKTNNNVDNLEWCTAKYNINYGTARIRAKETNIKNGYWTDLRSGLSEKEYMKEYMKEYRKNNREKIREQKREYNKKNREKIREYKREYMREYMREYNKKRKINEV